MERASGTRISFASNTKQKSHKLAPILEMIREYLPKIEFIYTVGRVTDVKNKTVEQLRSLRDLGMSEISLGVESGDDWTLERISKGYHAADILEQCHKLDEAGIAYWMTFLNGVAGKEHSHDHAVNSALIFNQCHPMVVGTGGLTLFPGTPLLEEAERGEFTPLSEKEMLEELKTFAEILDRDCGFITHHTLNRFVGPTEVFVSGETLQLKDYSKLDWEWSIFDPEAKRIRHETVFPKECQRAFELGTAMAEKAV